MAYLGLILSNEGIKMESRKVETITQWESPKNVHDIQVFLGFANFYRRFIQGYSSVVAPMTALTRTEIQFEWSEACEKAFQARHTLDRVNAINDSINKKKRHFRPPRLYLLLHQS